MHGVEKIFWLMPLLQIAGSHKCFVCGPDVGKPEDLLEIKRSFPNVKVPLCSKYRHSAKDEYLRECPTNSHGCLTKFEDNGSVLRTCAPIGIDDCKAANGVNYCYCSRDGCNTPDRRLSESEHSKSRQASDSSSLEVGARHRQGHELSLSPPATVNGGGHNNKQLSAAPVDDEDNKEGSGDDWEGFYYDSYYDGRGGASASPGGEDNEEDDELDEDHEDALNPNANGGLGPDTEPGDGEMGADLTEPPPFLVEQQLEEELAKISQKNNKHNNNSRGKHKFDRGGGSSDDDEIIIVEEFATTTTLRPATGRKTTSGSDSGRSVSVALLVTCLTWLGLSRR